MAPKRGAKRTLTGEEFDEEVPKSMLRKQKKAVVMAMRSGKIFVQLADATTVEIMYSKTDTVQDVRDKVYSVAGAYPENLTYMGRMLKHGESTTMIEYDVYPGATLESHTDVSSSAGSQADVSSSSGHSGAAGVKGTSA